MKEKQKCFGCVLSSCYKFHKEITAKFQFKHNEQVLDVLTAYMPFGKGCKMFINNLRCYNYTYKVENTVLLRY